MRTCVTHHICDCKQEELNHLKRTLIVCQMAVDGSIGIEKELYKEINTLKVKLAIAEKAMIDADAKILEGIPYGTEKGPTLDAARDTLYKAREEICSRTSS